MYLKRNLNIIKRRMNMNIFRRNHEGLVSGDAIPLYHNGVFHIFYLTSPPNTVNWPERIRTTWQHAITKDLINFIQQPI